MKRILFVLIAAVIALGLALPTIAAGPYTDVADDAWYAESVSALREKGLMVGLSDTIFGPNATFTRAQLATVLYRMAGEPAVIGEDDFTDTENGTWYSDAVLWASQNGVVKGYGNGLFGTNDPTTQEQLATMLWRDAGSYVLGSEYADANGVENNASAYAVDAVRWARVDDLLNDAIAFAPKQPASRGQVADMVYRYLQLLERFSAPDAVSGATQQQEGQQEERTTGSKVLVAYFSCTNNTGKIAGYIAEALEADLYQITPEVPYTDADRNYNDSSSRTTKEQNDPAARPVITGTVENMAEYDVILLGYPIWWGQAPKIMYTFVESYDLSGKTIVPFCTSGSSPIGSSAMNLSKSAPNAHWLDGNRFSGEASRDSVVSWINGLALTERNDIASGMKEEEMALSLKINGAPIKVSWEDNASVDALRELVGKTPLTVSMSPYGGFEQVGSLGTTLPHSDVQTATQAGDIMLYSGSNLVMFYGSNTWAYTSLGRLDLSAQEVRSLLGGDGVTVTLAVE